MYRAFLRYVFRANSPAQDESPLVSSSFAPPCSTSISRPKDITNRVQRKGDHYVKMGEYADLWLGTLDGSTEVAVKVLRGGSSTNPKFMEKLMNHLNREAKRWRLFNHPNVSAFHGIVKGWGYMPGLVLPLYQNTVVEFVSQSEKADLKVDMIRQIAEGLVYIHSNNMVHGDIRGANILMDAEDRPRICDCGLTSIIEPSEFTSVKTAGACRWTAPELMIPSETMEEDPTTLFNTATDIYAFAMLIIEIFTGKIPFSNKKNDSSVIFAVLDGGRPDIPSSIVDIPALRDFLELCWHKDPQKRPSSRIAAETLAEIAVNT
ncbi:hypothetical protein HWV62_20534 [Athelia sp. TMB]|nr:hypothetical protein HWV62_20534 [Athelia sp. TMB]